MRLPVLPGHNKSQDCAVAPLNQSKSVLQKQARSVLRNGMREKPNTPKRGLGANMTVWDVMALHDVKKAEREDMLKRLQQREQKSKLALYYKK